MLGHALFEFLSEDPALTVYGTTRNPKAKSWFAKSLSQNLLANVDIEDDASLLKVFRRLKPDVVINCIGLIKQINASNDVLQAVPINSLLPHRLAKLTKQVRSRLILMSTDCVFSGKKGNYKEQDQADCNDLYGQSKLWGEIADQGHVLTLRTSIIGHELRGGHSLVNWFLKQNGNVAGYTNAIYSGLPTVEMARVIRDYVLPNKTLSGLYHVSTAPISKYDLLSLIAKTYQKNIRITKSSSPKINRSLNCSKFKKETGYKPKSWDRLIQEMHAAHQSKL